eukprot:Phypoly_transcript_01193.p1 GENE.Phypoly_transcript_01193~~Phypoly_transcript_01193.p1  ORF type:complete len:822 (+),score=88.54 Phypoly_transcript_01193:1092-3557(+)
MNTTLHRVPVSQLQMLRTRARLCVSLFCPRFSRPLSTPLSTTTLHNNAKDTDLFISLGLDPKKAKETATSTHLAKILKLLANDAGVSGGCAREVGVLLYTLATKLPSTIHPSVRTLLATWVKEKKLKTVPQLSAALEYVNKNHAKGAKEGLEERINELALGVHCGVGVVVSTDVIELVVKEILQRENNVSLMQQRRAQGVGPPLGVILEQVRTHPHLRWVDGATMKNIVDQKLKEVYDTIISQQPQQFSHQSQPQSTIPKHLMPAPPTEPIIFPPPEENIQSNPQLLENHLRVTGGKIVTRFPPEPNGYLHIGHAKAMHLDFGYASQNGGTCYLRFDDTNPETEKQEYVDSIIENIGWLGYQMPTPTYSSTYFDELYLLAEELIKRGKAYVCHQTPTEIAESRAKHPVEPSPFRDRLADESLAIFREMKKGLWKEGTATLRMKMSLDSPNPCMWDLVAYRIKQNVSHPITKDKWCIYPSYDFTHCLCDSLQNITHSLCTLEFLPRRESYYWLVEALGLYKPLVWEYSRLNITHTILSKRKLVQLVKGGYVTGWDDCRMPTINGIRRRGYPAAAIRKFCELIGVTRNQSQIRVELLEHCCREALDFSAPRRFVVLRPLKVVITNYHSGKTEWLPAPDFPHIKDSNTRKLPFSNTLYIEQDDFREKDAPNYYGLAPGKWVALKYGYAIRCDKVVRQNSEIILECIYDPIKENSQKQQGHIHWVSEHEGTAPNKATVNLYQHLFLSENPLDAGDKWLEGLNPTSLVTLHNCYVEYNMHSVKPKTSFQFERLGFFISDITSTLTDLVFNLTVGLRESKKKLDLKN